MITWTFISEISSSFVKIDSSSPLNRFKLTTFEYVVTVKKIERTKMSVQASASPYFSVMVKNAIMLS